jgi:hypothetical protein
MLAAMLRYGRQGRTGPPPEGWQRRLAIYVGCLIVGTLLGLALHFTLG